MDDSEPEFNGYGLNVPENKTYISTFDYQYGDYSSEDNSKNTSTAVLISLTVLSLFFCSVPYWLNFAMISGSQRLRELTFTIRGYRLSETEGMDFRNINPKGFAWSNTIAGKCLL